MRLAAIKLFGLIAVLLAGRCVLAQPLTIDITKGIEGSGIPITIASFGGGAPEDIASIVASDLQRTGKIAPQPAGSRADYSVTGQASRAVPAVTSCNSNWRAPRARRC